MKYKGQLLIALLLVFVVALWLSTIYWMPALTELLSKKTVACADPLGENCGRAIGLLGSTGDLFGGVTSLFSALALFAVALTLWIDVRSRLEGKKPLVISVVGDDSISLDKPAANRITCNIELRLSNQATDAALNVRTFLEVAVGKVLIDLQSTTIATPLIQGSDVVSSISRPIAGAELNGLLDELTREGGRVELRLRTAYRSLEGVEWQTAVAYELLCGHPAHRRRLNVVRMDHEEIAREWEGGVAVPLSVSVKPESWTHAKG